MGRVLGWAGRRAQEIIPGLLPGLRAGFALSAILQLFACGGSGANTPPPTLSTHTITGMVSGAVLQGATINLSGAATAATTTDATGNYSFPGLVDGGYTLSPSLAGYTFNPVSSAVTMSGSDVTGKNFTATAVAPATYSISGAVSGAVQQGVLINLTGAATATTSTGAGGNFSFPGLVNGSYAISPSLTGYTFNPANLAVTVSGSNVTGRNFTAAAIGVPTYSISGTVSGAVQQGVLVNLTGAATANTTTSSSGSYSLTGLANGAYTVTPSRTGYTFSPVNAAVALSGASVSGKNFVAATVPPGTWLWGVTTDGPMTNTAQQVDALKSLPLKTMVRTVFDLPSAGHPAAADYAASVTSLAAAANVMGLPVDSSYMPSLTLAQVQARITEYLGTLGPSVSLWEIGNEVNGNWLGSGVVPKIEAMYDAVKATGKATALTFYYENPATPGYDLIPWADANIPVGHRMRTGLDYVLVSYYEDQNEGHQLTQAELDSLFSALATRFPNAKLGFGEFGWGNTIPASDATRADMLRRFYGYRVPSVPAYAGGGFYWHFLQTMVPKTTPDWSVLGTLEAQSP